MREILFRGKSVNNGEWVEGGYYREPYTDNVYILRWNSFGLGFTEQIVVDPATVGQYTGLKDRNGKSIFEGDIVGHHVQDDILVNRGVVIWDSGSARFAHKLRTMSPDFVFFYHEPWEVIGNIHDNPELMEV